MKLSVIIPIFNGEDTLQRCLDSVVSQQVEDLEIILVNDGSTDKSLQICEQFAECHEQTVIIEQDNQGLSVARNSGLQVATGDYVTFVDCDDYLESNSYKALISKLNEDKDIDILEYSVDERIGGKYHTQLKLTDKLYTNWKSYWLETEAYKHTYACNKIFKKKIFSYEMFKPAILFEDLELMSRLLKHCHRILTTSLGCYLYVFNANGLAANATGEQLESMLTMHCQIMKQCCNETYFSHVINIQLDVYRLTRHLILTDKYPYKRGLKLTIYHYLGVKTLCVLHKLFWILRNKCVSSNNKYQ